MKRKSGVSRRDFLKSSALAGAAVASGGGALTAGVVEREREVEAAPQARLPRPGERPHPHHGRPRQRRVLGRRSATGSFVEVGRGARDMRSARVIDLRGRTVIPGLIESHTHFVSLANRPGYHVAQWELANNVAGVLAALAARRARGDVPVGEFITAMGAGAPNIWSERRACPRSPSSMPPCPTGRCSCTRAAAGRRASTRSARRSSQP